MITHFKLISELEQGDNVIGVTSAKPSNAAMRQTNRFGTTAAATAIVRNTSCNGIIYDSLLSHAIMCIDGLEKNSSPTYVVPNGSTGFNSLLALPYDLYFCFTALKVSLYYLTELIYFLSLICVVFERYECMP